MKLFDDIKLIEEIAELQEKGIHKNYLGTIVKMEGDIYTVSFYNPKNLGEYAFAFFSNSNAISISLSTSIFSNALE